jgi:membrane-associated phospholipid phosphatase
MLSGVSFLGILLIVLNSLKESLQSYPTRGVSTRDERFWSMEEIPAEIVPSSTGWAVFSISVFFLSLCVAGATKRDLSLRGSKVTTLTRDVPFRGWGVGVYVMVNLLNYLVTVSLKYFNHQMRPKTLAVCYQLLAKENKYNMTNYDGTLDQLRTCSRLDPTLFQGYPSGHSSVAFCGMFGCCLLLSRVEWLLEGWAHLVCCGGESTTTDDDKESNPVEEERHVPAPTGECSRKIGVMPMLVIRVLVAFVGAIGAAFVASSRVIDGSHFPYQVNAGSLIGMVGVAAMMNSSLLLKDVSLGGRLRFSRRGGDEKESGGPSGKRSGSHDDSGLNQSSVQLADRRKKRNTIV